MKIPTLFFCLISLSCLPQGNNSAPTERAAIHSDRVLIVYLSRTNNTKAIAEIIHEYVGETLVALELETPYPENYKAIVEQVANEIHAAKKSL